MKPVRADELMSATRPWQSPKHVLLILAIYIVGGGAAFAAIHWLHVPVWVAVTLALVVTVAIVVTDIVRWRRKRRRA